MLRNDVLHFIQNCTTRSDQHIGKVVKHVTR